MVLSVISTDGIAVDLSINCKRRLARISPGFGVASVEKVWLETGVGGSKQWLVGRAHPTDMLK